MLKQIVVLMLALHLSEAKFIQAPKKAERRVMVLPQRVENYPQELETDFSKEPTPVYVFKPVAVDNKQSSSWNFLNSLPSMKEPVHEPENMLALSKALPYFGIVPSKIIIRSHDNPEPPPPPPVNHKVIHIYFQVSDDAAPLKQPKRFNDYTKSNRHGRLRQMHTQFIPSSDITLKNVLPYNENPSPFYQVPMKLGNDYYSDPVPHSSMVHPQAPRMPAVFNIPPISDPEYHSDIIRIVEPRPYFYIIPHDIYPHVYEPFQRTILKPLVQNYAETGTRMPPVTELPVMDNSIRPVVEENQDMNRRHEADVGVTEAPVATTMASPNSMESVDSKPNAVDGSKDEMNNSCVQKCVEEVGVSISEQICGSDGVVYPSKQHFECTRKCSKEDLQKQHLNKCVKE